MATRNNDTVPKTTVSVSFGNIESAKHLSAEVRPDLNSNKDSFAPGDTVVISVFSSNDVSLSDVASSSGTVTFSSGVDTVTIEDELTFEDTNTSQLSVPAVSITSQRWVGRDLGDLTLGNDKMTVIADKSGVAIAKVTYSANASRITLVSPKDIDGELTFSILVMVYGTVT